MTNDPRIVRAFIKSFCLLFLVIGGFLLLIHQWFFGSIFVLSSMLIYKTENQKNDEREKEFIKNSQYNKQNKQVVDDFKQEIKEETKNTFSKAFSKENGKQFKKRFLLFYGTIACLIVLLLGIFISWLLAFFILGLLIFVGILYYLFINYLFRH